VRVDLALFDGDTLLERSAIVVTATQQADSLRLFRVGHKLGVGEVVDLVLDDFADHLDLAKSTLRMPVHESPDWESIEIGRYTLAFWCHLDAENIRASESRLRWAMEGVDDVDKSASFKFEATARRPLQAQGPCHVVRCTRRNVCNRR
jgi:hypothetical protein